MAKGPVAIAAGPFFVPGWLGDHGPNAGAHVAFGRACGAWTKRSGYSAQEYAQRWSSQLPGLPTGDPVRKRYVGVHRFSD